MAANLVSAVDSFHDHDYVGGFLSLAGEIPVLGDVAVGAKIARTADRAYHAYRDFRTVRIASKVLRQVMRSGPHADLAAKSFSSVHGIARTISVVTDAAGHVHHLVPAGASIGRGVIRTIDSYKALTKARKAAKALWQAHHFGQAAAFARFGVPNARGIAIRLVGNIFTQPHSQHWIAHWELETFWDLYRHGGVLAREALPTVRQYTN
jgi:hypothetical protein